MAKGRFNRIKGTKDFLVGAVICVFLCLWSIRDAWFPSEKVRKKHPQRLEFSMKVSGTIKSLPVIPGTEVGGDAVLVELYDSSYVKIIDTAETAFEQAKRDKAPDVQEKLDALLAARHDLKNCVLKCSDVTLETSHGEQTFQGVVLEYLVKPASGIEAGQPVLAVQPKDTFFMFNKTLAILTFIGAFGFLFFHRIASK